MAARSLRSLNGCIISNKLFSVSAWLGDAGHTYKDFRYFVPGRIVYDPRGGEAEDALERADCIGCGCSEDTVLDNARDSRIVLCDAVELLLHLQNLLPRRADGKIIAWP